jgi:hypothetical protein
MTFTTSLKNPTKSITKCLTNCGAGDMFKVVLIALGTAIYDWWWYAENRRYKRELKRAAEKQRGSFPNGPIILHSGHKLRIVLFRNGHEWSQYIVCDTCSRGEKLHFVAVYHQPLAPEDK